MFRIGDKVRIIKNFDGEQYDKYIGTIATILSEDEYGDYLLDIFDAGVYTIWRTTEFVNIKRKEKLKRILSFCHDKN